MATQVGTDKVDAMKRVENMCVELILKFQVQEMN
jgi:hypothetical protein